MMRRSRWTTTCLRRRGDLFICAIDVNAWRPREAGSFSCPIAEYWSGLADPVGQQKRQSYAFDGLAIGQPPGLASRTGGLSSAVPVHASSELDVPRLRQLPQRRGLSDRRRSARQFHLQRGAGARSGERSDGTAQFRLGLTPAAAREPDRQRHAVVDLRRQSGGLQPGPRPTVRARHPHRRPDRSRERLCVVGRVAHDLGAGRPEQFRHAVRHAAAGGPRPGGQCGGLLAGRPVAAAAAGGLGRQGPVVRHRHVRHGAGALGRRRGGGAAAGRTRHRQQRAPRQRHPRPAGHRPELLQFSAVGRAVGSVVRPRRRHRHDRPARTRDRQRARAGYAGGRIPGAAGCLSPGHGHQHVRPGDDDRAWAASR